MPGAMLVIAVASVLLFISILVLLALAAFCEYTQLRRIRFDPEARPFTLSLTDAFDPEHVLLWTTQLPALRLIAAGRAHGLPYRRLFRTYERSARMWPELYEGSSFAQWLFFLERAELITMDSRRVYITGHGSEFLKFCLAEQVAA